MSQIPCSRLIGGLFQLSSDPSHNLADDLAGTLAARRQLGTDTEQILIEGFLERTGHAIDARVDERIAQHRVASGPPGQPYADARRTGPKLALSIVSLVLAIPLTAIAASVSSGGLAMVLLVWIAIVAVNVSFHWSQR